MLVGELLVEKIDNLFPSDRKKKEIIAQEVFDMIQQSYASQGGMKGSGFNSPEDMIEKVPFWKIFRRGNNIKAAVMYKDKLGRKLVAVASDGSKESKKMLGKILIVDVLDERSFAEISGLLLKFLEKQLGSFLYDYAIPAEEVQQILSQRDITPIDEFRYTRIIGGEPKEKIMVGTPYKWIKDPRE